jgi:opacity protein-like surface antigen
LNGTFTLAWATGWEARAGAEYLVERHWIVRAGYRHHSEDRDNHSPRNELKADRATVGAQYSGWGHWNIEGYGYHEWWRTDYPDPLELGGPGTGLGLTLRRLF